MPLQRIITNAIENNAVDSTKIADNAVGIDQLSVSSDGNAGEFLQTNGSGILSFATAASTLTGGSGLVGMQVFDTPGSYTWTKAAGVKSILYFVTGGGQGGQAADVNNEGYGGRSASTVMGFLDVSNITSETGTIGAGSPGDISAGTPSPGQNSNFGTHAIGTANGLGTGGQVRMHGVLGDLADWRTGTGSRQGFGQGALSFWGAGPGSGGDGGNGSLPTNNPLYLGQTGKDGIVIVLEFA